MSNNYFNFKIPSFNEEYGEDWEDFKTIVDDNVDHIISKTIDLYKLRDPSRMPIIALEKALQLRGIDFDSSDSVATKKYKLRKFNPTFRDKGLGDPYLDLAENITGTRGWIIWFNIGATWGVDAWGDGRWGGNSENKFIILFNVKTTNSDELDTIVSLLQSKTMLPAFYKIFLIDDDYNTLREV